MTSTCRRLQVEALQQSTAKRLRIARSDVAIYISRIVRQTWRSGSDGGGLPPLSQPGFSF
jgi:hypothetical protein